MKLYYSKGACSLAVRIIINELGLSCEYESVDIKSKPKKTETGEEFLRINPKGVVPVLVTDEGKVLTENVVILQYLAEKNSATTLLPPISNFNRYRVLEWLNFIASDLHKAYGALFNSALPQEIKNQIYIPLIKNHLKFIDKHLQTNQYLMGDTFTLPDAYLYVILNWNFHFKIEMAEWPNIHRYFKELQKRPSVQQSLKDEGLLRTSATQT